MALALAAGLAGAIAVYFVLEVMDVRSAARPAWTEVRWPFPIDQWGKGARICLRGDRLRHRG
jgi:hypothetical protein